MQAREFSRKMYILHTCNNIIPNQQLEGIWRLLIVIKVILWQCTY